MVLRSPRRDLWRRLASLVVGMALAAALGMSSAPIARADDLACTSHPTDCVTMRVNVTGYLDGHGFDQATGNFNCAHTAGSGTSTCTWAFYLLNATRVVTMTVQASNPAGATVCVSTTCGSSPQSKDITLTKGGKGPTVSMSINPAGGHTVTVSKGGSGTGTVTSDKGGISCGSACTWMYADSTLVILTASPTGGSTFAGWSDGGTCQGQDATCHVLTGTDITTQAIFNAPATPPPTPSPTPTPTPKPTPTPTPHASSGSTPPPSAGHSTAPTVKPPTPPPGSTAAPGGPTLDPNAPTADPNATLDPNAPTIDPNAGPTPTPFRFSSDDPNRTEVPLNALPTPGSGTGQPAADAGGPPIGLFALIAVLGILVFGGVFWWARRRNGAA